MNAASSSNYHSRNWRTLADGLRREQIAARDLSFRVCTSSYSYSDNLLIHLQLMGMTRAHSFATDRIQKFEGIIEILSTHNISRLSNILLTSQQQHLSLGKIAERLVLEAAGTYQSTGHYTDCKRDFALLSLRLGGY
jgi:hypothetical protein